MRLIIALTALFAASLQPVYAGDIKRPEAVLAYYKKCALKEAPELKRCSAVLAKSLKSGSRAKVDTAMRRAACFDRYSGFIAMSRIEALIARASDTTSVEQVGDALVVGIPDFDHAETDKLLKKKLEALPQGVVAESATVVLDLRGNTGGDESLLDYTLQFFAPAKGVRYMRARFRCSEGMTFTAPAKGVLADKRYVVLVDGQTTSIAEWLAAHLRYEWYPERTVVVGVNASHTFGKAVIHNFRPDLGVQIAAGRWSFPGHDIQGVGIRADVVLKDHKCGEDRACLLAALKERSKAKIVGQR